MINEQHEIKESVKSFYKMLGLSKVESWDFFLSSRVTLQIWFYEDENFKILYKQLKKNFKRNKKIYIFFYNINKSPKHFFYNYGSA